MKLVRNTYIQLLEKENDVKEIPSLLCFNTGAYRIIDSAGRSGISNEEMVKSCEPVFLPVLLIHSDGKTGLDNNQKEGTSKLFK